MSSAPPGEDDKVNPLKVPRPIDKRRSTNPIVFFEFTRTGEATPIGTVEIELFKDAAPLSAESIRALCHGAGKGVTGLRLNYEGTLVDTLETTHFTFGNVAYSAGEGDTVYGEYYEEARTPFRHVAPGVVSVVPCTARKLPDPIEQVKRVRYYSSQLCVAMAKNPELDKLGLVVGRVLSGLDVAEAIVKAADRDHVPTVFVSACGEVSSLGAATREQKALEASSRREDAARRAAVAAAEGGAVDEEEEEVLTALKKRKKPKPMAAIGGDAAPAPDKPAAILQKKRRRFF